MKKNTLPDEDILPEYDFSQGVRGKYAKRYAAFGCVSVTSSRTVTPNARTTA